MQINRSLIRSERERRAWSQEHLATVAGLGVRTIQRMEATGLASYESIKAIAAVLEMPPSRLTVDAALVKRAWRRHPSAVKTASAIGVTAVAAMSAFLARNALAEDVMLSIGLSLNDQEQHATLLTPNEKEAEIVVDGVLRLIVLPTIRADGTVYLATQIFESDGANYLLVSEPELTTPSDQAAEIHVSTERGNAFTVKITPHVQ